MTRRFLTFLGLPMAAQVAIPTCGSSDPKVCEDIARRAALAQIFKGTPPAINKVCWKILGDRCKPANGECPVCGTMARKVIDSGVHDFMVRCANCSAAFWQDTERKK
jgi:hypothetical protein